MAEPLDRRQFLFKAALSAGLSLIGASLAWIFGSVWTASGRFSSARWVQLAPLGRLAPDSVTSFLDYKVAVIRTPGGVGALSLECTHLGCLLNVIDNGFFCPCHGSSFGTLGQVYSGPATKPLPWHRIVLRDGNIWVHLGERLAGPVWLEATESDLVGTLKG